MPDLGSSSDDDDAGAENQKQSKDKTSKQGAAEFTCPHHWKLLSCAEAANITVVDCNDSLANCFKDGITDRVLLFDGFSAQIPPDDLQEQCQKFSEDLGKQTTVTPCIQKICTDRCVQFSQALRTKNWTEPAERILRSTFWGSQQFHCGCHEFVKNKEPELQSLLTKLFRLRYQCVKAEFQFVGSLVLLKANSIFQLVAIGFVHCFPHFDYI